MGKGTEVYRIEVDKEWMLPLLWELHCWGRTDFEMVDINVIKTTSRDVVDVATETFIKVPHNRRRKGTPRFNGDGELRLPPSV